MGSVQSFSTFNLPMHVGRLVGWGCFATGPDLVPTPEPSGLLGLAFTFRKTLMA